MKSIVCPIASIEYYNHDTRRILLDVPPAESLSFKAGQYLQLVTPEKKFPFSIASSPTLAGQLELHIRPTAGSDDSAIIEALLDDATTLEVEIPLGDCFVDEATDNTLILMAASTGITQMKSIIEFLETTDMSAPIHLYWGVLSDKDLYLNELCESWCANNSNFHYTPVVSEPESSPNWQGRTGLVGDAVLADFDKLDDVNVVVSGGPGMVYATLDAFVARGMPEENMSSDIFSYAPRPKS